MESGDLKVTIVATGLGDARQSKVSMADDPFGFKVANSSGQTKVKPITDFETVEKKSFFIRLPRYSLFRKKADRLICILNFQISTEN